MPSTFDLTLGVQPQAWAILHLLTADELEFAEWDKDQHERQIFIRTFAWYNGLERGIALTVQRYLKGQCLVITFGEHRVSDDLFVDHWVVPSPPHNSPTVDDMPENTLRCEFPVNTQSKVVERILGVMESFYRAEINPVPDGVLTLDQAEAAAQLIKDFRGR